MLCVGDGQDPQWSNDAIDGWEEPRTYICCILYWMVILNDKCYIFYNNFYIFMMMDVSCTRWFHLLYGICIMDQIWMIYSRNIVHYIIPSCGCGQCLDLVLVNLNVTPRLGILKECNLLCMLQMIICYCFCYYLLMCMMLPLCCL